MRRIHRATVIGALMKAAAAVTTIALVDAGLAAAYVNWIESWL
jgi:hypothetical protein